MGSPQSFEPIYYGIMRQDRREPVELQDLINRKVKVRLSTWEKRNLFQLYRERFEIEFPKNDRSCPSCIKRLIEVLAKGDKYAPILVKEKMIVNEPPAEEKADELIYEHTGAGWYEFSNGHRVRGKANAEDYYNANK
jgi:hypothetical protein